MKERKILAQKIRDFEVQEFISRELTTTGYTRTEIQRTPLGDKVIVYTSRPGLVVGRKGANIKKLTDILKRKFNMDNPQIEIGEVTNPLFDAQLVAERIAFTLERYGAMRFKSVGYKILQQIIDAGALGAEITISGRGLPSSRAKSWKFMDGYLKKSGDISQNQVSKGLTTVNLRSGTIGIKVVIMTPDIILPDKMYIREAADAQNAENKSEAARIEAAKEKEEKKKPQRKKSEKKHTQKPHEIKPEVKVEEKPAETTEEVKE